MSSSNKKYSSEYEEWYKRERTSYQESYDSSQKRIDEILLIVTIPALGWLAVGLNNMVNPITCYMKYILCAIVVGFIGVIVFNLLSLLASVKASERMIADIDSDCRKESELPESGTKNFKCWREITRWLNYAAYCLFFVACVSFALLIIENVNSKLKVQQPKVEEEVIMERKGNIPLPPSPKPPKKEIK